MTDLLTINRKLRERIEQLEYEVGELRGRAADWTVLKQRWNIHTKVARMLIALSRGGLLSRQQLLIAVGSDADLDRAIDTLVKRARKACPELKIKSTYSAGYQMTPDSCAIVRAVIAASKQRVAA